MAPGDCYQTEGGVHVAMTQAHPGVCYPDGLKTGQSTYLLIALFKKSDQVTSNRFVLGIYKGSCMSFITCSTLQQAPNAQMRVGMNARMHFTEQI